MTSHGNTAARLVSPAVFTVLASAVLTSQQGRAEPDTPANNAAGKAAMTTTCPSKPDAARIRKAAETALDEEGRDPFVPRGGHPDRLTPLLPDRWPEPRGVAYYTYTWLPRGTGMPSHSVLGPVRQVVFVTLASSPRIDHFKRVKELDSEYQEGELPRPEDIALAEQALLEVIQGCQTPEAAIPKLEPYRAWLRIHPVAAKDLRKRQPAFMNWLFPEGSPPRVQKSHP